MYYPHEKDMGFVLESINKINRIQNLIYTTTICKNIQKIKMFNIFLNKVFHKWTNHRNYDMRI